MAQQKITSFTIETRVLLTDKGTFRLEDTHGLCLGEAPTLREIFRNLRTYYTELELSYELMHREPIRFRIEIAE